MIARKLLSPDSLTGSPRLRFGDHLLLTQTVREPYLAPAHLPGPGIVTCLSGTGRFTLNGETEAIDATRFLLTDTDSRLSYRLTPANAQPLLLFFQSDLVGNTLARQEVELCWLERAHPMTPILRERLTWLVGLGNNCSSFSALKADALIGDILRELLLDAAAAAESAAHLPVSKKSTRVRLFRRLSLAKEWIHAQYASAVTLDAMAARASLNSQHFLRMFRDCFGLTPHQYLTEVRLAAAQRLLAGTRHPVTAICRMAGFESPSSFSGLFRERFGASPKTYRQNQMPVPVTRPGSSTP